MKKKENRYVLSAKAKSDLKRIANFTIEKFGIEQSLRYAEGLKDVLINLTENPEIGRRYIPTKNKMLLRYNYKVHVIFYYPTNKGIYVVRVLGGKMNLLKHIK